VINEKMKCADIGTTYKQTILKSFDVEHYRKKERKPVYM